MSQEGVPKAVLDSVKYLAFEGGGGRGAAFVGALQALREKHIIRFLEPPAQTRAVNQRNPRQRLDSRRIRGVAGTSAGAITACLLAAGWDDRDFANFIKAKTANTFYDDPDPYRSPTIRIQGDVVSPLETLDNDTTLLTQVTVQMVKFGASFSRVGAGVTLLKESILPFLSETVLAKKIASRADDYLVSLIFDLGIFSGNAVRAFIDKELETRFGRRNITFAQLHKETNGVYLRLAGVCLNTAEAVWFDHLGPWKNMAVADGVRISMGIPGAFKPVAITKELKPGKRLDIGSAFLLVDGGMQNNLPIHAFDELALRQDRRTVSWTEECLFGNPRRRPTKIQLLPEVLALRLTSSDETKPRVIGNVLDLPIALLNALLVPSETNQIRSANEASRTIDLNTGRLDTLVFAPDDGVMAEVTRKTHEQTMAWINRAIADSKNPPANNSLSREGWTHAHDATLR